MSLFARHLDILSGIQRHDGTQVLLRQATSTNLWLITAHSWVLSLLSLNNFLFNYQCPRLIRMRSWIWTDGLLSNLPSSMAPTLLTTKILNKILICVKHHLYKVVKQTIFDGSSMPLRSLKVSFNLMRN